MFTIAVSVYVHFCLYGFMFMFALSVCVRLLVYVFLFVLVLALKMCFSIILKQTINLKKPSQMLERPNLRFSEDENL